MKYFDPNYPGPAFELYGPGHLTALAIVFSVIAFLIWGWRNPSEEQKRRVRILFISIMLVLEISWHGWNAMVGIWSVQKNLPLHLCSISAWSSIYILMTRDYRVFEIIFFIGIAGASQSLLTPEAGIYGLPHFRALQTLSAHGMIVIIMVYMATIEGYRPTWASVWKTLLALNVYLVVVTPINYLLGSNYMYTLGKPTSASLLDHMGPWPWYLLWCEFLALLLFSLLYLPFAISNSRLGAAERASATLE